MTPAFARASYRRLVVTSGETISLVRGFGGNSPVTVTGLRARVIGFRPDEVTGGVQQGGRKVILLAEDLEASAIPTPAKGDRVVWNGKTLAVTAVDDASRRIGGIAIAFELEVAGA